MECIDLTLSKRQRIEEKIELAANRLAREIAQLPYCTRNFRPTFSARPTLSTLKVGVAGILIREEEPQQAPAPEEAPIVVPVAVPAPVVAPVPAQAPVVAPVVAPVPVPAPVEPVLAPVAIIELPEQVLLNVIPGFQRTKILEKIPEEILNNRLKG